MNNQSKWVGYILAAIATVLAIVLFTQNQRLNGQVSELERAKSAAASIATDAQEIHTQEVEAQRVELEADLADAQALIEELETRVAKAADASITQAEAEAGEAGSTTEREEAEDAEDEKTSLDEFRKLFRDNPQISAQARALMEMTYADLFAALDLDPTTKAALRDLLLESQIEQIALGRYAMELGDVTYREQDEWVQKERAWMADQLRELLSDEEFAAWEEYQTSVEERVLEATFQNQLRAFSSGLTPENHDLVLQVALEEFLDEQDALRNSDTVYTLDESLLYQIRAMARMRERLSPLLSEEQYAELDNWLRMGEDVIRDLLPNTE